MRLFELVQARQRFLSSMRISLVAGTSKIICMSSVAGATRTYVNLNVRHFAAQISCVEALGQSRSKSNFSRIGRDTVIGKAPVHGNGLSVEQTNEISKTDSHQCLIQTFCT